MSHLLHSQFQIRKSPHPLIPFLLRQVSPWLCPSTRQGVHLSVALENSTLRRILNFFSSCFRFLRSYEYPQLLDAIGLFEDEELVGTWEDRFVAVDFDFATLLSSPFCSCILFAIVFAQLIKLEFLAQQVELKWLMLNKWRRLFHSSRVKLPLVKMSASWCLVSMCRIWISESRLILSNNQSKATLWVLDTCLIVGLRPLIIILITASLSSNTCNLALKPECVPLDGMWSMLAFVTSFCPLRYRTSKFVHRPQNIGSTNTCQNIDIQEQFVGKQWVSLQLILFLV